MKHGFRGLMVALALAVVFGSASNASAQCTFVQSPADGSISQYPFVVSSGTASPFTHTFNTFAGHSYYFDVRNLQATNNNLTINFNRSFCPSTDLVGSRDVSAITPNGGGGGTNWRARTFLETTASTFVEIKVTSPSAAGQVYVVKVADTTMYSPAWSTNSTYDTYYSFDNTTNATCTGDITLYNLAGTQVATGNIIVTAGSTGATNTVALAVPRNTTGTAKFTHDCPPGAFVAQANIANFTSTPAYIQPTKFEATRQDH